VVAAAYLGWNVLAGGADDGRRTATPDSTASASPDDTTAEPKPDPKPTADAEGMETFVVDYLATVTSDPQAAWQRLTPGFQAASGSFDAYAGWWSQVQSADVTSASADPEAMQVSYAVTYQMADGSTMDDDVTLDLVLRRDGYLIAGES
jgi:hypothetical protein